LRLDSDQHAEAQCDTDVPVHAHLPAEADVPAEADEHAEADEGSRLQRAPWLAARL
jgi:hypothetical protein